MTRQQKLLWEELTKEVRNSGMDNFHARELYDKINELMEQKEKTVLSIIEKGDGLEVRMSDAVYNNLAIVGLLEKIKLNILDHSETKEEPIDSIQKYDA
jgi:hypothetical protein